MSFLDLILKREKLINNGYNNIFLDQSLHTLLSLPFFNANDCDCLDFNTKYIKEI